MSTTLIEQIRRDAMIVAFNDGEYTMVEDTSIRRPVSPELHVIEFEDMTDAQKRIINASQTMLGNFPQNLSKDELRNWIEKNLF